MINVVEYGVIGSCVLSVISIFVVMLRCCKHNGSNYDANEINLTAVVIDKTFDCKSSTSVDPPAMDVMKIVN